MFVVKKIISAFLLPPGIFILLLGVAGVILIKRKKRIAGLFNLAMAVSVWALATAPVADRIMAPLEMPFADIQKPSGDVIVVLGGGIYGEVPDLSGKGAPSAGMLPRIVTAARLQRRLKVPIIVSGGRVYRQVNSEAAIAKRFLTDLGVPGQMVILEEKSRDTYENAIHTKEICRKRGFNNPIVLTSAYHLKRALTLFERAGLDVTGFPADFRTAAGRRYGWQDFLPSTGGLDNTHDALHEYLGLLYYRLVPKS